MLKAVAAIYLPTPAQMPDRVLLAPADDGEVATVLAPLRGQTILLPGEAFDPAAWNVDPAEAAHLVATGAAELLPSEAAPQPDAAADQVATAAPDAKA